MRSWFAALLAVAPLACSLDDAPPDAMPETSAADDGDDESTGDPVDPGPDSAVITHAFGGTTVFASDEVQTCVSWTLDNEQALYVQAVTLANLSGFHHSNWFVVPDDVYEGDDGFWPCATRNYDELAAATAGTVLFAQSTQSWLETQRLGAGVVIKIPPHSRIVGGVHLLNLAPRDIETDLWLTLEVLHPRWVASVVTPMQLSFLDLQIGAMDQTRHDADCDMALAYQAFTGLPWDVKVHYALPHFHELGNWFDLRVVGGPRDGESLYRLEGFDADANGRTFDPPIDLSDATGLGFSCGYDNFRSEDVGWGYGDQEMCVMLLLVESQILVDAIVPEGEFVGEDDDGILHRAGECLVLGAEKSPLQGPPTLAEREGTLVLPPADPDDAEIPPVPACTDVDPDAEPLPESMLADLRAQLFAPACSFGACHGASAAAGLDLTAADLHTELLEHEPLTSGGIPLVTPGEPENSWLYRVLAECSPMRPDGSIASHMPLNAPVLIDPAVVASVRRWIAAGAPD